jgi:hypothetical protein
MSAGFSPHSKWSARINFDTIRSLKEGSGLNNDIRCDGIICEGGKHTV